MRRRAGRNEANLGQADAVRELFGQAQMGAMNRIEGSAQYADWG